MFSASGLQLLLTVLSLLMLLPPLLLSSQLLLQGLTPERIADLLAVTFNIAAYRRIAKAG